jgi:hypothetical protein
MEEYTSQQDIGFGPNWLSVRRNTVKTLGFGVTNRHADAIRGKEKKKA